MRRPRYSTGRRIAASAGNHLRSIGGELAPQGRPAELHQSARITTIGLTRPARHAGTAAALTVTINNTAAAAINTTGSRGDVSNNIDCTTGAATSATEIPTTPPTVAIFTASRTARPAAPPAGPPNGSRTPIARGRCLTTYDSTANSPTATIASASSPNAEKSVAPRRQDRSCGSIS